MLANWITLLRLPVLMGAVACIYAETRDARLVGVGVLLLGLALDTLDGIVARGRHQTSVIGSVLDIAADRAYEIVLWFCFADLELVPLVVPIVVVVRSVLIDGIRSVGVRRGTTPFAQMKSRLGRFLVASTWLRTAYGVSKMVAFGGLALTHALASSPDRPVPLSVRLAVQLAVWSCVTLCLVRGVPVVVEGMGREEVPTAS